MKSVYLVIIICLALLITFCAPPSTTEAPTSLPPAATEVKPGIANPASVYCKEQGGQLEIRDGDGGQSGYCIFLDGSECEEWAYFRNECAPGGAPRPNIANPASVFCEEHDGKLEIRDEQGGQVGYCIFPDGLECEEWAYFRNECAPGNAVQPTPVAGSATGELTPLPAFMCSGLAESMKQTLGVYVSTSQVPFQDIVYGKTGTSCQLKAMGSGVNFPDYIATEQSLRSMLETSGWKEDIQYSGGGPNGSVSGYRLENRLCQLYVGWDASADAQCSGKPVSECNLTPEQKLYTITLDCVQEAQ
jgi:putative hemolysin